MYLEYMLIYTRMLMYMSSTWTSGWHGSVAPGRVGRRGGRGGLILTSTSPL